MVCRLTPPGRTSPRARTRWPHRAWHRSNFPSYCPPRRQQALPGEYGHGSAGGARAIPSRHSPGGSRQGLGQWPPAGCVIITSTSRPIEAHAPTLMPTARRVPRSHAAYPWVTSSISQKLRRPSARWRNASCMMLFCCTLVSLSFAVSRRTLQGTLDEYAESPHMRVWI